MPEDTAEEQVSELPLLTSPRAKVHYIANANQLEVAAAELMASKGPVAIDAERASGFKYSQRAYLVQLRASNTDIFLLDPVEIPETTQQPAYKQLVSALSDREWILHAATQDLSCLAEIGMHPGAIFDTELAARLAGQPRVGLGALAESLLDFRLAKEHSAADWSTRPLPESWLNYAALDVDVLHELQAATTSLLESQGKFGWAQEEFQNLLAFRPKPQRADRWRSISGLSKVTDRLSLEIARQLWMAREELAKRMDVAPGRLIPDASILIAATTKPKSRPELASLRTFTGRASRSYLDLWWEAINKALRATELPSIKPEKTDAIPNHRNWINKFPEADRRLKLAKASLVEISERTQIPLENLLTPDLLRQLSFTPPAVINDESVSNALTMLGARSWQVQQTSGAIAEAFTLAKTAPESSTEASPLAPDEREALSNQAPEQQSL